MLQAAHEVGDSKKVGEDGQGGVLAYLKVAAIEERKTFLLLMGRILPMKIVNEVKQFKSTLSIQEAVAELKALGMDELLALYLKRYPIGPDEEDTEWADMIDVSLAPDPLVDVTPEKTNGSAQVEAGRQGDDRASDDA